MEKCIENDALKEEHGKLGAWLTQGKASEAEIKAMRNEQKRLPELAANEGSRKEQKRLPEKLPIGASINAFPQQPKARPPQHLLSQASSWSTTTNV